MFNKKMSDSTPEEVADIELGLIRAERRVSEAFEKQAICDVGFPSDVKDYIIKHVASQRFRIATLMRGMRAWSSACHELLAKARKEKGRADYFEKLCLAYEKKLRSNETLHR